MNAGVLARAQSSESRKALPETPRKRVKNRE
jgi:hypothetical protein